MMFVNQINLNWFSDTIIVFSNHWFFYLVNIALIKFGAHGSLEIDVKSESQMLLVWAPLWTLDVGRVLRQVSLSTLIYLFHWMPKMNWCRAASGSRWLSYAPWKQDKSSGQMHLCAWRRIYFLFLDLMQIKTCIEFQI